jgi:hypothetical protein
MTAPLCPACGRRGSERYEVSDGECASTCRDPFHDAADYGPMLLEALKHIGDLTPDGRAAWPQLMRDRAAQAVVAVEGRKGEVHDECK